MLKTVRSIVKKWKQISINFEGVFYQDGRYVIKYFSLVDEVTLDKKSGALTIRFGQAYIDQQRETKSYKYIDYEKYKKLRSPLAARLYEILVKILDKNNEWSIGLQYLGEKLTLEKTKKSRVYYPSVVLRQIKPALREIGKKTDLYCLILFNKTTGACIFKKTQKPKEYIPATAEVKPQKKLKPNDLDACFKYYSNLPTAERDTIEQAIERDPFIKVLPDPKAKVFAYMKNKGLWPLAQ